MLLCVTECHKNWHCCDFPHETCVFYIVRMTFEIPLCNQKYSSFARSGGTKIASLTESYSTYFVLSLLWTNLFKFCTEVNEELVSAELLNPALIDPYFLIFHCSLKYTGKKEGCCLFVFLSVVGILVWCIKVRNGLFLPDCDINNVFEGTDN